MSKKSDKKDNQDIKQEPKPTEHCPECGTEVALIPKLSFNKIHAVLNGLQEAFIEDSDPDEDLDPRFHAIWTIFLHSVGWTEDEFWEVHNKLTDNDDDSDKNETGGSSLN